MEQEQRQRQTEKLRETHSDGDGKLYHRFYRDCSTVYPGLLQAITARAQATSSLEKTFYMPFLIVISGL